MTETPVVDAVASTSSESPKRLYRAAGIGGFTAFAFWLLQPILVFLIVGDDDSLWATWEYFSTYRWNGLYETIAFCGIGAGFLLLVLATTRLVRRVGPRPSASADLGHVLGVIGASAWFLVAGITAAPFTSVGYFVPDFVPEAPEQAALYEAIGLVSAGVLMVFALAGAGWLVSIGLTARRRGVIGWPLSILAFLAAAAAVSPLFMPFSPPWGSIAPIVYGLVLGVSLLVKGRRA